MQNQSRLNEIDGIRGWAALIVVLFHFIWETFGVVRPEFRTTVTAILLNGPLAVYIFFVLSGDALSWPFINKGKTAYLNLQVLKRYWRLSIPIFVAGTLVYLLMWAQLDFHEAAASIVHRENWLGQMLKMEPTLIQLIQDSFFTLFLEPNPSHSFGPFLWPMQIELAGSFLVFVLLYALPSFKYPKSTISFLAILSFFANRYFCLFLVGLIFSILRKEGFFHRFRKYGWVPFITTLLFFGSDRLLIENGFSPPWTSRFNTISAVLIVLTIYLSPLMIRFFSMGFSKFLGQISFPLYLTHFSVLISYTSWSILKQGPNVTTASAAESIALSLLLAILLATGFQLFEKRVLAFIDRIARLCIDASKRPD